MLTTYVKNDNLLEVLIYKFSDYFWRAQSPAPYKSYIDRNPFLRFCQEGDSLNHFEFEPTWKSYFNNENFVNIKFNRKALII